MRPVEAFFAALDNAWIFPAAERIQLDVIGAGALHLQVDYARGTKDGDILEVVDVVVSKLKRFSPRDQSDIEAMIVAELVPHADLIDCFRQAVDFTWDAKAEDLPTYVEHLHRVERDTYGVTPTDIDLPDWI